LLLNTSRSFSPSGMSLRKFSRKLYDSSRLSHIVMSIMLASGRQGKPAMGVHIALDRSGEGHYV